jgi:hypothetical protein
MLQISEFVAMASNELGRKSEILSLEKLSVSIFWIVTLCGVEET